MTQHFVDQYRAFASNGASHAPSWIKDLRERGIARFQQVGFPSTRLEEWRFTNVRRIADRNPQYQEIMARLTSLYGEITRKALENEQKSSGAGS